MGTRERRQREKDEVREKIMEGARALFAEQGYEAVSMRKIAARIEYSPTAIYFHFADKADLFRSLCAADFLALAKRFQTIAKTPDPLERLRAIGRAYADFALRHPNHYRLMFMTPHPPGVEPEEGAEKGNPEEDAYAFLVQTVRDAIQAGLLRPELKDPELVAQVTWAAAHGIVSLLITKAHEPWVDWRTPKKLIEANIETLLHGIVREK